MAASDDMIAKWAWATIGSALDVGISPDQIKRTLSPTKIDLLIDFIETKPIDAAQSTEGAKG